EGAARARRGGSARRRPVQSGRQAADEQDRDVQRLAPRWRRRRAVVRVSWSLAPAPPLERPGRPTTPLSSRARGCGRVVLVSQNRAHKDGASGSLTTTLFLPVGDLSSLTTSTRMPLSWTDSNQATAPSTARTTSGLGSSRLISSRTMPTDSAPLRLTS